MDKMAVAVTMIPTLSVTNSWRPLSCSEMDGSPKYAAVRTNPI